MPVHSEKRTLPYTPPQLYSLVADIEKYPEFLPWCVGARIRERKGHVLLADMVIGFKMIREKFTSKVTLSPPGEKGPEGRIDVAYVDGPMRHMQNRWVFIPNADGTTTIDFYVDFEFRSKLLQKLIGALFHEAVRRMVAAFDARAKALYGPQAMGAEPKPI
jgi:coenzyme Q-binding protein COQ10